MQLVLALLDSVLQVCCLQSMPMLATHNGVLSNLYCSVSIEWEAPYVCVLALCGSVVVANVPE